MENYSYMVKCGFLNLKLKGFKLKIDSETGEPNDPNLKTIDIMSIFKDSKYVINIKAKDTNQVVGVREDGVIDLLDPINLKLKIPKRKITEWKSFYSKKSVDLQTNFNILFNGHFYLIYWRINPQKYIHEGSSEVKHVLIEIINNSEKYSAKPIPPTPFREDLICNLHIDNETNFYEIKDIEDEKINIAIENKNSINIFFNELFAIMNLDLLWYYYILENKNQLDQIENKMNGLFLKIAKNSHLFQDLRFYQIITESKIRKKLKKDITRLFINISKYQRIIKNYKLDYDKSLEEIQKNPYLKIHYNDFKDNIEYNEYNLEAILKIINYSNEIIRTNEISISGIYKLLIGSLLAFILFMLGALYF